MRSRHEKISVGVSLSVVAVTMLVLTGWHFEIDSFKSVLPGFISMKVNTAIGLFFFAVSQFLIATRLKMRGGIFALLGPSCAAIATLIGSATLAQYVFDINFGIDEFFYLDIGGAKTVNPGRLAPVTAVSFILLGISYFVGTMLNPPRYRISQTVLFIVWIVSFQAIVAYLLGLQNSFGIAFHTRIALHTAYSLIVLSTGMLLLSSRHGFMKVLFAPSQGGSTARRLISAAIVVPPLAHYIVELGLKAGLYEADFGVLLRLISNVVFFVIMVWRNSEQLHHAEVERNDATAAFLAKEQESARLRAEKHSAEIIHKNEARLRAIFESAFDAIIGMDDKGRICDWNPQAEKIFGWTRDEVIGRTVAEVMIPEEFRDAHAKGMKHFQTTGEGPILNQSIEVPALRKNGERFPIRLGICPVKLGDKYIFTAFAADISEVKKREEELVATRQQALKAAETKSEFLANMSHEIRTPLNAVIGMADLLTDTPLDPVQKKYAKIIQDSGTGLLTIINDILDFSKIEAGKLELERVEFDLLDVIEGQADLMAARAREKGLSFMTYIDPSMPASVHGDPGRISQVLLNLLGNAIKFTAKGSVVARAECIENQGGIAKLRISVKDSGIGLSTEAQSRLFQPFTQADGSTSRKYGGTGLGLSICRRLVELMEGTISVSSQEGDGSEFVIELKLAVGTMARRLPSVNDQSPEHTRILIIDDDSIAAEIVNHYLTNWGFSSHSVLNPRMAIDQLRMAAVEGRPYDLVIIDKRMPELDGFQVARLIREDVSIASTKMIMMTAFDRSKQLPAAVGEGFSGYLTKPIKQSELYNSIVDTLRKSTSQSPVIDEPRTSNQTEQDLASIQSDVRILIAEDNAVNQMVALAHLKKLGYQAQAVANGLEVIDALARSHFDLILMDCQMPEMDGYQTTKKIRENEAATGHHIPIIALTANALKDDQDKCLASGMDDYISKPFKAEKLAQKIGHWLQSARKAS